MRRVEAASLKILGLFLSLALGLFAAACGGDDGPETGARDPRIIQFSANPSHLDAPGNVTLAWETSGAPSLVLLQRETPLELGDAGIETGSIEVFVEESTTFELIASGEHGQPATARLEIEIAASIASFEAPEWVGADELGVASALLSWTGVRGADELILEPDDGEPIVLSQDLMPDGSVEVELHDDTTFTLIARGGSGEARSSAMVRVAQLPGVVDFAVDREWIGYGDSVELEWSTTHAARVEL